MTQATEIKASPSSATTDAPDLTGRTLGDYQVLRRLGRGGMGEVYLAEQRSLKRKVALKILRSDLAANPTALKRFQQEAEAVAKATHANIVQVYACAETDGITYMALEYVEGRNLKEFMAKKGPPDLLLAISFMRQIAAALQRASELGIIHRDIKPDNILLTRKGEVKVADFGLSRVLVGDQQPLNLTQSGVTMGTPLYMAPEQVEGKTIDPRTDIYSFGVTCYHMMSGVPPFTGKTAFEVALAHVRDEPEPLQLLRPDLPEGFCDVIHKMMAKDPADRYQTCRELLKDLSKVRESIAGLSTAVPSEDLDGEVVALEEGEEATAAVPTMRQSHATVLMPAVQRYWPVLLLLFAAGTIFLALSGGAALAWARYIWQGNTSSSANDPAGGETHPTTPQREEALRSKAEQYLNPQTAAKNPTAGVEACMDLGFFYLENNKLSDADKLYLRLEDMRQVEAYHTLGRVGHAIVLALTNRQKESNELFAEVFKPQFNPRPGGSGSKTGRDKGGDARDWHDPHPQLFQNPQMRFWLAEAIHYNEKNGIRLQEMPAGLRRYTDPEAPLKP
jgi:serine/threonine-protein kinase